MKKDKQIMSYVNSLIKECKASRCLSDDDIDELYMMAVNKNSDISMIDNISGKLVFNIEQTKELVKKSINRLVFFEPKDDVGYYLAFSGGKDSQCIYHLAEMAGVKFHAHYRVTSVDPPQLVRFIKDKYPNVSIDVPKDKKGNPITMWNLIPINSMPPTRLGRYCCRNLKESGGKGFVTVTGVRWSQSSNRRDTHGVVDIITRSQKTKKCRK